MFERFLRNARAVATQAQDEAQRVGASVVGSEHLLLALAASPESPAGRALATLDIDEAAVRRAIDVEFRSALERVGITLSAVGISSAPVPSEKRPRWGAPAKRALEQALKEAKSRKERHIGSEHILLALLRARAGAVPRLLDTLGVSPTEVETSLADTLKQEDRAA
jgi:ATP-dependent Clp protease ATP-binding subunit ClpA